MNIAPAQSKVATLTAQLRLRLTLWQKAFAKNPTANNWNMVTIAMLGWQQWQHALKSPRFDEGAIAEAALADPDGNICTIVVKAVTGQPPAALLNIATY